MGAVLGASSLAAQPAFAQATSYPVATQPVTVCPVDAIIYEELFNDRTNRGWLDPRAGQNRNNPPVGFQSATNNIGNADGTSTDATVEAGLNGGNGVSSPSGGSFVSAFDNAGNSAYWINNAAFGDLSAAIGGAIYIEKWNWRPNATAANIPNQAQDFAIFGAAGRLYYNGPDNTADLAAGEWETVQARLEAGPGWFFMDDAGQGTLRRRVARNGAIRPATPQDFVNVMANVLSVGSQVEGIAAFAANDVTPDTLAERYAIDTIRIVTCGATPPEAELVTNKTLDSGDDTPEEGDTVTFQIAVRNDGPDEATNVSLTDLLPSGLTATANNGTTDDGSGNTVGTYDATSGIWDIGTLANGASATLTLEGVVDAGQGGNTITNTTTAATGDQIDPDRVADDLTESVTIVAQANLVTTKRLSPGSSATPDDGDTVGFEITVTNNGTNDATSVSLTDELPTGLSATADNGTVSGTGGATGGSYDAGTGIWNIGSLANGETATLLLEGRVDLSAAGTTITNTLAAPASGNEIDPTTNGDDLTESLVVTATPTAWTCPAFGYQLFSNDGSNFTLGEIDLTNNQLQAIAGGLPNVNAAGYRTQDNFAYAVSRRALIRIGSDGRFQNLGNIAGLPAQTFFAGDFDGNGFLHVRTPSSNTIHVIDVTARAVVRSYTLSSATTADFAFNPVDGQFYSTNGGANAIRWNPSTGAVTVIGRVNSNGSNATFGAMIADATGRVFGFINGNGNVVEIDTATGAGTVVGRAEPASFNDGFFCSSASFTPPEADLVTVKTLTSGNNTPSEGDTVSYQIAVRNDGPANATNVTLTDLLPSGLTATANNGTTDDGSGNTVGAYNATSGIWNIGTLASGASVTLTLEGTVDAGQGGNTITNTTTAATGNQPDPTTTGDDLEEQIDVASNPQLTFTKVADDDTLVTVGQVITYTYTITNSGDVVVRNISVGDTHNAAGAAPLPGNETLLNDSGPIGDSTDSADDGIWDVLAPGDSITFTGTYTVQQEDIDNLQ